MNEKWRKNTFFFLASQTVSLFGSSLVQYAITWYITLETESGLIMTISIICGFLPTLLISPFAGVWADRYNRKMIIALSDSLIAFSTLILVIFFLLDYNALWLIFVTSIVRAFGAGVQTPAIGAFLPQIVPEDKLTRVNALNSSIQSIVTLISPMLSGILMTATTIEVIFFIDVITAIVAVLILLFFLQASTHKKASNSNASSYLSDMKEGIAYIKSHSFLKSYFLFSASYLILISPAAFLTPLQVTRSFGSDIWRLTAIEVLFSGGMIVGGIIMASWGGFKNKVHTMAIAFIIIGVCTFALGVTPVFWIYLLFMGLTGIAIPIFHTPSTVLLQQKVEENFLGRVFGILSMIFSMTMPLGMVVFGPIADIIAIEWLLIGTGLLLVVQSFFMLSNRVLIEAGK